MFYGFTLDVFVSVLAKDRTLVEYTYVGYLSFIPLVSKNVANKFKGLLGILGPFLLLAG